MFDWIENLIKGIGDSISSSLSSVWEKISGSIWGNFLDFIYSSVYNCLSEFFSIMTNIGADLFDLAWVKSALKFFSLFGWGLFLSGLIVAIFEIAIEYQNSGFINIKKNVLPFVWGLLAVNMFTLVPVELFKFCVNLQNTFAQDLAKDIIGMNLSLEEASKNALTMFVPNAQLYKNPLLSLVMMISMGYCVVKCFFGNIKRGGILLTQIAVGSLHMFSMSRGDSSGFIGWCKQVIAICFTTFMQTTLLLLGLLTMQTHALLGLGVMLAASEVPRIAQQFGLDTGMKLGGVMSVIHSTTSFVNMGRMIARK